MVRGLLRFVTIACIVFLPAVIRRIVFLGAVSMGFAVGRPDPARVGHF